jgi:hypothetical protein
MEVDMRGDHRSGSRSRRRGDRINDPVTAANPRSICRGEEPVDLHLQRLRLPRVGAARVSGGTHRALPEGVLQRPAPLPEAGAVEEPGGIESLDDVGDLIEGGRLAVPALQDLADLLDRMRAVEERDQVQQSGREHGDLIGEAGGIPERNAALASLLDRKGLEGAQTRVTGCGHSTSR